MTPRVYACFDAAGCKNPARSDLKHYFLLRAWSRRGLLAGLFADVHGTAPRFDPRTADVRAALGERLRGSDLLLLILSPRTAASAGWLHWEIEYAGRECALPIVCAYVGTGEVDPHRGHVPWWPPVLHRLLQDGAAARHVPFRSRALAEAFELLARRQAPPSSAGYSFPGPGTKPSSGGSPHPRRANTCASV